MTNAVVSQVSSEVLRTSNSVDASVSQLATEVLRTSNSVDASVSQLAVEVLRIDKSNTANLQLAQLSTEVIRSSNTANLQLAQLSTEVIRSSNTANVQLGQLAIEVIRSGVLSTVVSQVTVEVLREEIKPAISLAQVTAEVLRPVDTSWLSRLIQTNDLAYLMSTSVVTSDNSGNNNITIGNAKISGSIMANTIGIGNTSISYPNTEIQNDGEYFLNANGSFSKQLTTILTTNTTLTTPVLVDSFPITTFRSVEYLINIRDGSNSNFMSTKLRLLNSGSDVLASEYARLVSNTDFITFDANVSSSNVRVYVTSSISNTIIKMLRTVV